MLVGYNAGDTGVVMLLTQLHQLEFELGLEPGRRRRPQTGLARFPASLLCCRGSAFWEIVICNAWYCDIDYRVKSGMEKVYLECGVMNERVLEHTLALLNVAARSRGRRHM